MKIKWWAASMIAMCSMGSVWAQFALAVSPPRFELAAKPGDTIRQVLDLSNSESIAGEYAIKTVDWIFEKDASVTLVDDLIPNSCRPWVAIERKSVVVGANQNYRYRFEVRIPENAKEGECRFAIAIQGKEQTVKNKNMPIPISARMAVIVYVSILDAKPKLSLVGHQLKEVGGLLVPVIRLKNEGNAHGRLDGVIAAVDANRIELEVVPSSTPIMPGEIREVALTATRYGSPDKAVAPKSPFVLNGFFEFGKNEKLQLDQLHFSQ
jgi:P pilus assembly chaperone PapD